MVKVVITGYLMLCCWACSQPERPPAVVPVNSPQTEQEVDSLTGLVIAEHFELVRVQCTACHAAQLVTQNRATREGWQQMIRWMQESQGLWDLGVNEELILDYLEKHYGPTRKGRRAPLTDIEWYELK